CVHRVVRQSIALREALHGAGQDPADAASFGSGKDLAIAIFEDGTDGVDGDPFLPSEGKESRVAEAHETAGRSDPERSFAIFKESTDDRAGEAFGHAEDFRADAAPSRESAVGSDP